MKKFCWACDEQLHWWQHHDGFAHELCRKAFHNGHSNGWKALSSLIGRFQFPSTRKLNELAIREYQGVFTAEDMDFVERVANATKE